MPMIETPPTPIEPDLDMAALETLRPLLLAPLEDPPPVTVKLRVAYERCDRALRKVEPHRDALIAQFGDAASHVLTQLPLLMRAARQADIEHIAARGVRNLSELAREVRVAHGILRTDATSLANRGLIERAILDGVGGTRSHRELVQTTRVLVELLRGAWAEARTSSPLTDEELGRAATLATMLENAVRARDGKLSTAASGSLRTRALHALVTTYGELRAMLAFVRRREGDADAIAPSLYARRTKRRRDEDVSSDEDDAPSAQ